MPVDEQRFAGIARLYGRQGAERLAAAHVAVVGIGGVGSWAAEALARSGVGEISLFDLDDVCISNSNRQLHALDSTVGQPKVEVMAARIRATGTPVNVVGLSAQLWLVVKDCSPSANSMRVLFRLAETEVIDPDDPDRHVAFWRDHNDQCFARGRVQTIESTLDKDDSYPLQFDSTLRGLCVFHPTSDGGVVATDTPSWHLRSNVRVKLPKHYQNPRYRSQWQPYPQQENAQ